MRILTFITFLTAILFSEVFIEVFISESDIIVEFEMPTDESNESENSEESNEDKVEEDKVFEDIYIALSSNIKILERPCYHSILFNQSRREINSPPPDYL